MGAFKGLVLLCRVTHVSHRGLGGGKDNSTGEWVEVKQSYIVPGQSTCGFL